MVRVAVVGDWAILLLVSLPPPMTQWACPRDVCVSRKEELRVVCGRILAIRRKLQDAIEVRGGVGLSRCTPLLAERTCMAHCILPCNLGAGGGRSRGLVLRHEADRHVLLHGLDGCVGAALFLQTRAFMG